MTYATSSVFLRDGSTRHPSSYTPGFSLPDHHALLEARKNWDVSLVHVNVHRVGWHGCLEEIVPAPGSHDLGVRREKRTTKLAIFGRRFRSQKRFQSGLRFLEFSKESRLCGTNFASRKWTRHWRPICVCVAAFFGTLHSEKKKRRLGRFMCTFERIM